jgi:protocatechuate 3,4-dioxygenase beta subunit
MSSTRRNFVFNTLGGVGALALLHACNSTSSDSTVDAATTGADGKTTADSGTVDTAGFATGSGSFLAGKDYGNPFTTAATTCTVFTAATAGPCHSNTYDRQDITDGLVGLPTRLELLITDTSCNPISGAIVEIWFASPTGTYSKAATAESGTYQGSLSDLDVSFCTGNDSVALANNWLRGYQTTGTDGRVTFDCIFPGWYSGRTTHIHFTVAINGTKTDTSQLLFDETLTTAIYTDHASYSAHGDKDTKNATDNVVTGGLPLTVALTSFAQQSDGAILLWKQITVS